MAVWVSQACVDAVDYVIVGIAGSLLVLSVFGALYAACNSSGRGPAAAEFNYLWRARVLSQVFAALLALCQLLPLQVLWGPRGLVANGGFHTELFCRLFTAVTFGLAEPAFLLLALLSCLYSITRQARAHVSHPNASIAAYALGFTIPVAAAQVVCALFTDVFSMDYSSWLFTALFGASVVPSDAQALHGACAAAAGADAEQPQGAGDAPTTCVFCTFGLLSTMVSGVFAVAYLAVGAFVTMRIASAAISKPLVRRVRMLQALVLVLLPLSLACRGLTVLFNPPYVLGFVVLRLGYVVSTACLTAALSALLVLRPVADARAADAHVRTYQALRSSAAADAHWGAGSRGGSSGGKGGDGGGDAGAPTAARACVPAGKATAAFYIIDDPGAAGVASGDHAPTLVGTGVASGDHAATLVGTGVLSGERREGGREDAEEDVEAGMPMLAAAAAAAAPGTPRRSGSDGDGDGSSDDQSAHARVHACRSGGGDMGRGSRTVSMGLADNGTFDDGRVPLMDGTGGGTRSASRDRGAPLADGADQGSRSGARLVGSPAERAVLADGAEAVSGVPTSLGVPSHRPGNGEGIQPGAGAELARAVRRSHGDRARAAPRASIRRATDGAGDAIGPGSGTGVHAAAEHGVRPLLDGSPVARLSA